MSDWPSVLANPGVYANDPRRAHGVTVRRAQRLSIIDGEPSLAPIATTQGARTRGSNEHGRRVGDPAGEIASHFGDPQNGSSRPQKKRPAHSMLGTAMVLLLAGANLGCGSKAPPTPAKRPAGRAPAWQPAPPALETSRRRTQFPESPALQRLADAGAWIFNSVDMEGNRGIGIEFQSQSLDRELLALAAQVPTLNSLGIDSGCNIAPDALAPLDGMQALYGLSFSTPPLDDEQLSAIHSLPNLRRLETTGEGVSARGLAFLRSAPRLTNLLLYGRRTTDDVLQLISRDQELAVLFAASTSVTDDGLKALSQLARLRQLNLDDCSITDAGLANLAPLQNLQSLSLNGTNVTDQGLNRLITLSHLSFLGLCRTRVTDDGLRSLAPLKELTHISARSSGITAQSRTILPNVSIETGLESSD